MERCGPRVAIFPGILRSSNEATLSCTVGLVKVVTVTIAMTAIDKSGRRPLLLAGTLFMTLGLLGLGGIFSLDAGPYNGKLPDR